MLGNGVGILSLTQIHTYMGLSHSHGYGYGAYVPFVGNL